MFLKVKNSNEEFIIDGVGEVCSVTGEADIYNRVATKNCVDRTDDIAKGHRGTRILTFRKKDSDDDIELWFNTDVYLMNDRGETIEAIRCPYLNDRD
jgi:hypothetical protein